MSDKTKETGCESELSADAGSTILGLPFIITREHLQELVHEHGWTSLAAKLTFVNKQIEEQRDEIDRLQKTIDGNHLLPKCEDMPPEAYAEIVLDDEESNRELSRGGAQPRSCDQ